MPLEVPGELAALRSRAATLAQERARLVQESAGRVRFADLARVDAQVAAVVAALADPLDASPEVPLVLLPVRVETRLRGSVLRVRVAPDTIHVDALVRSLGAGEVTAGRAYWSALWADAADPAAWPTLLETVGPRRAAWVAEATTPTNLADRGQGGPEFPGTPAEVTRGTVARCLPDRFVVRVQPRGGSPVTRTGAPVPRDLPLAPVVLHETDDAVLTPSGLRVPAGSEWVVDFEAAKEVGLGVEVPLDAGARFLDHVVVAGVRGSASEADNAAELADLLRSHRFADGLDLLPAGTPTNNADADRSPYRPSVPQPPPPTTPPAEASPDAEHLASFLGLDGPAVERLLPAGPRPTLDLAERAANTALWFVTWEGALDRFIDAGVPGVSAGAVEAARRLHRDHVRGAGPAPAVRVGSQPYGVLPVARLAGWRPRSGETTHLLVGTVARALDVHGDGALAPHVRPGGALSDEDLLAILGTSPVSEQVRARVAVDAEQLRLLAAATGAEQPRVDADRELRQAVLSTFSAAAARSVDIPSVDDRSRAINLPLVSVRDEEVATALLDGGTPAVDSVLQALLALAWDAVEDRRFRATPPEFVEPVLGILALDPATRALVLAADAGTSDEAPARFFEAAAQVRAVRRFEDQPDGVLDLADLEPVAAARTSLAQVALDVPDEARATWVAGQAVAGLLDWFGVRVEVAASIAALVRAPIDERRLAVGHALDLASHRADAWATGLATARRRTLAAAAPTGATLGAWGYVEEVDLTAGRRDPAGWVHAPSPTHAVTAGVLAAANRSNVGARDGERPFAIDLTSRRGPQLRRVLEGVRAGQDVGALLGYQLERGLTGPAARFQLSLRELAPLATDELGSEVAQTEEAARSAAADVVDGVALLHRFPVGTLDDAVPPLRAALDRAPVNPFLQAPWDPVNDAEWEVVEAAVRGVADTLDAVSDALLGESVLQYASGNASRAAAAMDAVSAGGGVDPALGVLGTRQSGAVLTHGVLAVVPRDATGWSTTRPRAVAEPRLEAWAARRLGDPGDVVVAETGGTRVTLAGSGLAALDLVCCDDAAALDLLLRDALPALGDAPLATARAAAWPAAAQPVATVAALARTLRGLLAGAAPAAPASLVRQGVPAQRTVDTAELRGRCDRLLAAFDDAVEAGRATIEALDADTLAADPADVPAIAAAVAPLAAFGATPRPDPAVPGNVSWAWAAWQSAVARGAAARATLAAVADDATPDEVVDAVTTATQRVLGDGFVVLPLLDPPPADDAFAEAVGAPLFPRPARAAVSAFVRDHAAVQPGTARLAEAQLLGTALRRPVRLDVVQLTERRGASAAPGTDRWLAGPLPAGVPWPASPATHLVVETVGGPDVVGGTCAVLAIDSWTEALPYQPPPAAFDPAAPPNPLREARATTGLAVQADQASARAPQVVLSVISPDGARWTTDSVVEAVLEAVRVAKARVVTLEHSPALPAILPAIHVRSAWLDGRRGLDLGALAGLRWRAESIPFLTEVDR